MKIYISKNINLAFKKNLESKFETLNDKIISILSTKSKIYLKEDLKKYEGIKFIIKNKKK